MDLVDAFHVGREVFTMQISRDVSFAKSTVKVVLMLILAYDAISRLNSIKQIHVCLVKMEPSTIVKQEHAKNVEITVTCAVTHKTASSVVNPSKLAQMAEIVSARKEVSLTSSQINA